MKHANKTIAVLLIGGSLIGTTLAVQAKEEEKNDALAVTNAKVSLQQAVGIALKTIPGTPAKAEFENEDGTTLWEVEVVDAKQQVFDLEIDATSGAVLKQAIDKDDEDDKD